MVIPTKDPTGHEFHPDFVGNWLYSSHIPPLSKKSGMFFVSATFHWKKNLENLATFCAHLSLPLQQHLGLLRGNEFVRSSAPSGVLGEGGKVSSASRLRLRRACHLWTGMVERSLESKVKCIDILSWNLKHPFINDINGFQLDDSKYLHKKRVASPNIH